MPHYEGDLRAPAGARFAILASRWNPRITDALVTGARKAFADHGVEADALDVVRVPGAWELPQAALHLAASGEYAALVALGCVVRGDTRHYEQVADGCAEGLMKVALETGVPVVPVAVHGTTHIRTTWRIRPHKVTVRAGKPLSFPRVEDPTADLARAVTARIWPCVELQWNALGGHVTERGIGVDPALRDVRLAPDGGLHGAASSDDLDRETR